MVVFILNTAAESGGYHRETHHFSEEKSAKELTAPQHTRFILPPFHSTKFFACLAGRYFSFWELYLESYISRLNEILRHDLTLSVSEPENAAAKQGQELRSEQTVTHYMSRTASTYFLRLNNSETFVENAF